MLDDILDGVVAVLVVLAIVGVFFVIAPWVFKFLVLYVTWVFHV